MEMLVTTGAMSRAKLQSNRHHRQTNIQLFTDLLPDQQCRRTEGKLKSEMRDINTGVCFALLTEYLCIAGDARGRC